MTIIEPPQDDIDLAKKILDEHQGSQRLPLAWTVRLAQRVIVLNAKLEAEVAVKEAYQKIIDTQTEVIKGLTCFKC
jgi:hypothetical protein